MGARLSRRGHRPGFPFDRPSLDLYDRCLQLAWATRAFLREPPADLKVTKSLERLHHLLRPVECDVPPFASVGTALTLRANLFTELRDALRLKVDDAKPACEGEPEATKLQDIRTAVATLDASLRARRPARGPAKDTRHAIDLIVSHLDRHGPHLWGHAITIPVKGGTRVRLVDRTNNILESFFHALKHGERRRSGRKILTQDFERLPPAAALAVNLTHADYVQIVCGSLDRLPAAFAKLDAANRSRSVTATARPPTVQVETASLSTADRRLIRTAAMGHRIMAAAQSL